MADPFQSNAPGLNSPATKWALITPNDSTPVDPKPRGLFIGGDGNVVITGDDGVAGTFAVTAGSILPVRPTLVKSTGTTATPIYGLV